MVWGLMDIRVGKSYQFFSTLQGIDGHGIYPCLYTGRWARVLREIPPGTPDNEDPDNEPMYAIRFPDGAHTQVWAGEINGYFFETRQFHGPFAVNVRPDDNPATYLNNKPRSNERVTLKEREE